MLENEDIIFTETGLKLEELEKFGIYGLIEHNKDIIHIPTDDGKEITIDIFDGKEPIKYAGIFNKKALLKTDAVIVANTIIDTLLIMQNSDFDAISAANYDKTNTLIDALKKSKNQYIYICSDIPQAEKIFDKINKEKSSKIINLAAPYTSIQERVYTGDSGFVEQLKNTPRQLDSLFYSQYSTANDIALFKNTINANKERKLIKTGYNILDNILGGGLYSGLYVLAAGTGAGKTTLALNIANNIAEQKSNTIAESGGADILYFSFEMSKNELIARCVSRISHQKDNKNALTENEILYTSDKKTAIYSAISEFEYIARNFYIFESVGNYTIDQIKQIIETYKEANKDKDVVVVIDYLQLMAPADIRLSDKQNADKNILELKRISRDQNIPIIVLSSINRGGYDEPITLQSIKESGGIEFCASVVIGIQPNGMDYIKQDDNKFEKQDDRRRRIEELAAANSERAKAGEAIEMQIKILKNRAGNKGDFVLNYWPKYNRYGSYRTKKDDKTEYKQLDAEKLPF